MIFVPLPLFATVSLALALIWFVSNRDMTLKPHQFFAALVLAYCVQSAMLCLRWGYEITALRMPIAVLAPVLPVLAWLAYQSLSGQRANHWVWLIGTVGLCWLCLALDQDLADGAILLAYLMFGVLLLVQTLRGEAVLALPPVFELRAIRFAMGLTGAALVLSASMDLFVVYDFVRNDGANVALAVSLSQTVFVLVIGLAATFGRSAAASVEDGPQGDEAEDETEDAEVLARLEGLFDDHIHRNEDLSLRKLARRLGVPDRRVSTAINRARGINVSQFVNEFRIKDACDLLVSTDQSILQVSLAVGFASKSNFNREFVRVTGETPSGWRSKRRGAAP